MLRLSLVLLFALPLVGCSKLPSPSASPDVKSYLSHPVNKPAFEKAVLGRSTKEINDLLGPPAQSENSSGGLGWVYHYTAERNLKDKSLSTVVLLFQNNAVYKVLW
jgi:hypothetical protein